MPAIHGWAAQRVTTETLLREMIDMVGLTRFPDPAYKTVQFSSYDRRSKLPGGPNWFANSDGFGNEPIPNFEAVIEEPNADGVGRYLICDVKGPGAIVRTWTAAIAGTIRVVLDDQDHPLFDGPAEAFLHQPYLAVAQAAALPPVAGMETSFDQQDACYFPMPFAQRCRIEWTGRVKDLHFYEVQVRQYPAGTPVETFRPQQLEELESLYAHVGKVLADPQRNWQYQSEQQAASIDVDVPVGQIKSALKLEGARAIERLELRVVADDLDAALRQTVLHVVCDDHSQSQVQCPVGDFFGAGPGVNPYNSVPFTVSKDGTMTCRFVMPFARRCEILLENKGPQPVRITGSALPLDLAWNESRSMHFRARWRVDHDLVADGGRVQDLPFVVAQGRGVYVGTAVMLLNPNPVPASYGSWWGEGDEKIFVDDDVRPSIFGTGSEDYFNYSWSIPDIFLFAYCGQPRDDGPANRGFVVNYRWHILDALPFQQRLAFYMELYSHERTEGVSYARTGYHYGRPQLIDDSTRLTKEDVRVLHLPENWKPAARMGARNSTFFEAEDVVTNTDVVSAERDNLWSGGQLLTWKPTAENRQLSFTIPVKESGKYALRITGAMTPRAGRISAVLDGAPLPLTTEDNLFDMKTDFRTLSRTVSSRDIELSAGRISLDIRAEGSLDDQPVIGIDFLWLQKR
jgi:hypothetical protein